MAVAEQIRVSANFLDFDSEFQYIQGVISARSKGQTTTIEHHTLHKHMI